MSATAQPTALVVTTASAEVCAHGYAPGDHGRCIEVSGTVGDLIDQHRRAGCRRPQVFWHPRLLRKAICCATCQVQLR